MAIDQPHCASELKAGQLGEHEVERERTAGGNVLMSDFCAVKTALEVSFEGGRECGC